MNSGNTLFDYNQEFMRKVSINYVDFFQQSNESLDNSYRRGYIDMLILVKQLLQEKSEYKYVSFTDIMSKAEENIIENTENEEYNLSRPYLSLSGIKLKSKKKRTIEESQSEAGLDSNTYQFQRIKLNDN